jgi:hypothetical protein
MPQGQAVQHISMILPLRHELAHQPDEALVMGALD